MFIVVVESLEWTQYDGIMIPPKEKEGYWKQFKNYITGKGQDPFKSHAETEIKRSILEVLPDLTLTLHDDLLMTGEAALKKVRQVLHCVEINHSEQLVNGVSI